MTALRLSTEVVAADWLRPRLAPFGSGVASMVPLGFPAYARILHRVVDVGRRIRWADAARRVGSCVQPGVLWSEMVERGVRPDGCGTNEEAPTGELPLADMAALLPLLAHHTGRVERCWMCVWVGWPDRLRPVDPGVPRVKLPGRDYLLYEGVLFGVRYPPWHPPGDTVWQPLTPNLFWPDDRAWVVGTDVDLDSTYVAGSDELIDTLLDADELEAVRARPDEPV